MKTKDIIRNLRLRNGYSQKELGHCIGVSAISVGNWENGSKLPSATALISLSEIFKVSIDYLLGKNGFNDPDDISLLNPKELNLVKNYRYLDSYGRKAVESIVQIEIERINSSNSGKIISADFSARYIPKYLTASAAGYSAPIEEAEFEMIKVTEDIPHNADFAVKIQGNSMSPYINDGDTVYVKKEDSLEIGDVGIFSVDGAMYCKQFFIDEDKNLILASANENLKHTNVIISPDSESVIKCYGKVLINRIDIPSYLNTH